MIRTPSFLLFFICWFAAHPYATAPPITCLAFSPDGNVIVAGSQAGLQVYRYPDLHLQRTIEVRALQVHDLAFSPSGHWLAVGGGNPSESGMAEIFSLPDFRPVHVLSQHTDSVMTVVWLNDENIATGSLDYSILLWDVLTGKPDKRFDGHSRGVSSLCFLNDGETMVSTGIDQSVRVWNRESGELNRSLNNHTQPIYAIKPSPIENGLPMTATAGADRSVRFWQPTIGRMVRFARLESEPLDIVWFDGGKSIAASCKDGRVRIVDPLSVEIVDDFPALEGLAYALSVHPSDGSLVVGGSDGQIRLVKLGN